MNAEFTISLVRSQIKELEPKLDPKSDNFKTAVVVLSSLIVGPNIRGLVRFTGYGRKFIRIRARRLFESGIWQKDGKIYIDWFHEKWELRSTVSFWLDVLVASGEVEKVPGDPDKFRIREKHSKLGDLL